MEDHHWPRIVHQLLANRQALLLKLSLHGLPKANLKGCVAAVRLRYTNPVPATPSTIKCCPVTRTSSLFKWRHIEPELILLCVRWYCEYQLSYRDLEEIMRERGFSVDHSAVWRWERAICPGNYFQQRNRREHVWKL
jgi:hypothetical protein